MCRKQTEPVVQPGRSSRNVVIRTLAACPLTVVFLAVSASLFVAVQVEQYRFPDSAGDAYRKLGAVSQLAYVGEPELHGPFDIWSGQWWRILVSAFHHGGIWHLAMNFPCLVLLGCLLEPRMPRVTYAVFFLSAAMFTMLPEVLLGHAPIGLSGVGCAQFGALLVLRRYDHAVARHITERVIRTGFAYLVGCLVVTEMNLLSVSFANAAHFGGVAFGWLTGFVLCAPHVRPRLWHAGFYAAQLTLVPAVYVTAHPVWSGRYHWYLSAQADAGDLDGKRAHLERAVACDATLYGAWRGLTRIHLIQGRPLDAWKANLLGAGTEAMDSQAVAMARLIWLSLPSDDARNEADDLLVEILGDEADTWRQRLEPGDSARSRAAGRVAEVDHSARQDEAAPAMPRFSLEGDNPFEFPDAARRPEKAAPQIDPDAPESAAEGITI